jgi:hypothetical protein
VESALRSLNGSPSGSFLKKSFKRKDSFDLKPDFNPSNMVNDKDMVEVITVITKKLTATR